MEEQPPQDQLGLSKVLDSYLMPIAFKRHCYIHAFRLWKTERATFGNIPAFKGEGDKVASSKNR